MKAPRDYYRILHVQPDAPFEIIRATYRTLMHCLKMHPDLGGNHSEAALINEAFATLRDAKKRAAYDRMLSCSPDSSPRGNAGTARTKPAITVDPRLFKRELERTVGDCDFCGESNSPRSASRPEAVCLRCESPLFPAVNQPRTARSSRAFDRLPRSMPVIIRLRGLDSHPFAASTEDISIIGARLSSPVKLPAGQILRLESSFCTAVGSVRQTHVDEKSQKPRWHIGVEFITLLIKEARGVFISTRV